MPTNFSLSWANLGSLIAVIAGAVGMVLTPIYGDNLAHAVQAIITAISGFLIAIPTWHVASVMAHTAKAKADKAI